MAYCDRARIWGREKVSTLGVKQARAKRDEAGKQLADSIGPGANRKAGKSSKTESAAKSFEVIA